MENPDGRKNKKKHMDLSFKKFLKESKRSTLVILDLSFCTYPIFSSLNPLFESTKNKSARTGNDFAIVFSNPDSVRWARKNFPKFGRHIIEVAQDPDSIKSWFEGMYEERNYQNLAFMSLGKSDHFLMEQIAKEENGNGGFFFQKISGNVVMGDEQLLKEEQDLVVKNYLALSDGGFEEFCRFAVNPEIITESPDIFNEFRRHAGFEEIPKMGLFKKRKSTPVEDPIRESYISGNLFSVGDLVYLKSDPTLSELYRIKMLGTNYVVVESEKKKSGGSFGKGIKKWIDSVIPCRQMEDPAIV